MLLAHLTTTKILICVDGSLLDGRTSTSVSVPPIVFTANDSLRKGQFYESSNVADNIGRCTLYSGAMHVVGRTKGIGPECNCAFRSGLQPVPAWDSPARFE